MVESLHLRPCGPGKHFEIAGVWNKKDGVHLQTFFNIIFFQYLSIYVLITIKFTIYLLCVFPSQSLLVQSRVEFKKCMCSAVMFCFGIFECQKMYQLWLGKLLLPIQCHTCLHVYINTIVVGNSLQGMQIHVWLHLKCFKD